MRFIIVSWLLLLVKIDLIDYFNASLGLTVVVEAMCAFWACAITKLNTESWVFPFLKEVWFGKKHRFISKQGVWVNQLSSFSKTDFGGFKMYALLVLALDICLVQLFMFLCICYFVVLRLLELSCVDPLDLFGFLYAAMVY